MRAGWALLALPAAWAVYAFGSYAVPAGARWRGNRAERAVALTFDDGPDPTYTPRVLDALGRLGVAAAFFLIGRRAERCPDLARRIAAEGHDLGNHTYGHRSLWLRGPAETEREIVRGHEAIERAAGAPPRFFRAPWGLTNLAAVPVLRRLGTPCVFWTLQPESSRAVEAAQQAEWLTARAAPGAIVDLHDADGVPGAGRRTLDALPAMVAGIREAGYRLAPLRELL